MLNLKDKNKQLLFGSLAAGVVLVGVAGWLSWKDWSEVEELRAASAGLRGQVSKADGEIATIPRFEDEVLILRENLNDYVAILPDDNQIHAFVDQLVTFAGKAGVEITKLDDTAAKQRRVRKDKAREAFDRVTYKLSLHATADELLAFVDSFENTYERFVKISTFRIDAFDDKQGAANAEEPKERAHEIEMEIETYVYNAKAKGAEPVDIPEEARKVEALRKEGRIESASDPIRVVRYEYRPKQNRRDPFVDPRLSLALNGKVPEGERRRMLETLDRLRKQLQVVTDAVQKEAKEKDAVRRIQAQEETRTAVSEILAEVARLDETSFFRPVPEYDTAFRTEIVEPLRELQVLRGKTGSLALGSREIEERVESMAAALAARDFAKVVGVHDDLLRLRPAVTQDERTEPLYARAEELAKLAGTHLDFEKMEFRFGGCVCYAADPKQSVIIIDDKSFSPGETVADGLVITKITPAEIEFAFRGITVVRRHAGDGGR